RSGQRGAARGVPLERRCSARQRAGLPFVRLRLHAAGPAPGRATSRGESTARPRGVGAALPEDARPGLEDAAVDRLRTEAGRAAGIGVVGSGRGPSLLAVAAGRALMSYSR